MGCIHTNQTKIEIQAAFERYLIVYFKDRDANGIFAMMGDEMSVIGTAFDEIALNLGPAKELYLRDLRQVPKPIDYTIHNINIQVLAETVGLVNAVISIRTEIEGSLLEMGGLRLGMIFQKPGDNWKIVHKHISAPTYDTVEGESFPLEELQKRNQWLENKINQKTQDLIEANLQLERDIEERKKAEQEINLKNMELQQINATKDKFFSIIAHDLRGPLASFMGLAQIIAEDLSSLTMSEIQGIAVDMKNSATNLFRLLENLLNWARMQKGRITFTPEIMVLLPVVGESVEILREQAKTKKIQIDLDIPDDLEAYADKNIFQTIVRNLVSNAIKFTHRGGNVLISAFRATDREVQISIRDTGIGMEQELIDNLFRVDVKTNRKGTEGELSTGLGLLLCKEFVEKHRGKIWVESIEGKGTVFHLSLPNLST